MADAGGNIKILDMRTGRTTKIFSQIGEFAGLLIHILCVHILILIHILSHTCASSDFQCIVFIF